MNSERRIIESAQEATMTFGGQSRSLEKGLVGNASVDVAYGAVEIYRDARLELTDADEALRVIGLDTEEKVKLFCDYLGGVLSRNPSRGRRGRDKEFEINQIRLVYEGLLQRFPDIKMSQAAEKGGRQGRVKKTGKPQPGGRELDES